MIISIKQDDTFIDLLNTRSDNRKQYQFTNCYSFSDKFHINLYINHIHYKEISFESPVKVKHKRLPIKIFFDIIEDGAVDMITYILGTEKRFRLFENDIITNAKEKKPIRNIKRFALSLFFIGIFLLGLLNYNKIITFSQNLIQDIKSIPPYSDSEIGSTDNAKHIIEDLSPVKPTTDIKTNKQTEKTTKEISKSQNNIVKTLSTQIKDLNTYFQKNQILFLKDTAALLKGEDQKIKNLVIKIKDIISKNPSITNYKLLIHGHSASVDSPERELTISRWRSHNVMRMLENHSIDNLIDLEIKYYGSTNPLFNNPETEEQKQKNRRVYLELEKSMSSR